MKSWTDWRPLNKVEIKNVPAGKKGVYAIRKRTNVLPSEPDIIYIGQAGTGEQALGKRLYHLLRGIELLDDSTAANNHSASPKMRRYVNDQLEFSWIESLKAPDGLEKAFLLAFYISANKLPECNEKF